MVALFVMFTFFFFIGLDMIVHKKKWDVAFNRQKKLSIPRQEIYVSNIGLSMADGGKRIEEKDIQLELFT